MDMSDKKLASSTERSKIRWGVVWILALIVATIIFDVPKYANMGIDRVNNSIALGLPRIPEKPFSLGLDLQGGTHLEYRAIVDSIEPAGQSSALDGVRDVIERRVNGLGVGETNVQTTKVGGDYRVIVDLPGVTDVKKATAMIGETPILEFKEQNNEPARTLTADEKKQMDIFNAAAKKKADQVLKELSKGKDFAAAVKEYSDDQPKIKDNNGYVGYVGEQSPLGETIFTWLLSSKPGEVATALIKTPDGWTIAKRGGEREGEKQAQASHILICYIGAKGCDNARLTKDEAKQKAEELFKQANANNFAELAKANSSDPGSKDKGGDLGVFPKGAMVPPFDAAVFSAKVGQIVGPIETDFGYHVIYKTNEITPKEFELSRILIRTKSEQDILPPADPWKTTGLSGKQLKHAEVVTDPRTGTVEVSLQFNDEGKTLFADITSRNIGKPVGIFLDGTPISVPTVNSAILNGQAVITGQFGFTEAKLLATRLNAGALPVPVELISQEHIGATLGAESLAKSLKAGIVAFLVIMLFMILYYRLPGFLATIALALYVSLSLAIIKLFGIAMSLAGIAGFIMSIGVAVDANVLIFERMREELKRGRSLLVAVEEGFLRAWTSIRDSNISTLITCSLLMMFGSSFVKGFAVTLAIGILVSMFSAITVTRILLRFVVPWFKDQANWLFLGAKKKLS
jgi:protein-export membrane protein SecD